MLPLYSKSLIMLLAFLLSALTQICARTLEKPVIFVNRTMIIDEGEISHQNITANNTFNDIVNVRDIIGVTKTTPRPKMFIKNGVISARKLDSDTIRNTRGNSIIHRLPWKQNANLARANSTISNRTVDPVFTSTYFNKRLDERKKYPNHSNVYRNDGNIHDEREFYTNDVDYDHQTQDSESEYPIEGNYNTYSEDQGDDNGNNNIEDSTTDPWRVSYSLPNMGYFLPSMTSTDEDHPVVTVVRECNCPSRSTRSYECRQTGSNWLSVLSALGQNLWALVQLIITNILPFFVPLIILKLIIIPLKILKFIKLVKLFLKIFVIIPFILRILFPALSNTLSLPSIILQNLLGTPLSYSDPRQTPHRDGNNLSAWNNTNATTAL